MTNFYVDACDPMRGHFSNVPHLKQEVRNEFRFWYFLALSTDGCNCEFRDIRAHCIFDESRVFDR
jgi:hypothetical protein